jgi:GT2 family glycosyltransferase
MHNRSSLAGRNGVTIVIPAYGAAAELLRCLESVAEHAADYQVVVMDDATPNDSIREVCAAMAARMPLLSYRRNSVNLGFVATCNAAWRNLRPAADLLLLNSDTEVTAGFLEEMQAVLYAHERHALVTPRSNSATIYSVPATGGLLGARQSYELWNTIRNLLPRYSVMPTPVGFCMLIRANILERFGLFDEVYSPGYNEENDFACRINRCGYSSVSANWAFVFHHENSSFGETKSRCEAINREVLLKRYPEYESKVRDYCEYYRDPLEIFAPLYAPHRPRVLIDLFHLPNIHCGTTQFALSLLRGLGTGGGDRFDIYVGIDESNSFFFHELVGHRIYRDDPAARESFDLVFRPAQIFNWGDLQRMSRLAPRVSFVLLDIIGVRCDYLNSPARELLFRQSVELADSVFTISDFSCSDFNAFFGTERPMRVIHLGTDYGVIADECQGGEYILLVGNNYAHKGVADALSQLDDTLPVVVLAGDAKGFHRDNVRWLTSGNLSRKHMRELYYGAKIMVYPSHYEGFGLPVLDALALGKPTIALDTEVNRELARLVTDRNLRLIGGTGQLRSAIATILEQDRRRPQTAPRRWGDVAQEYIAAFDDILGEEIDVSKLRARWETIRLLKSVGDAGKVFV